MINQSNLKINFLSKDFKKKLVFHLGVNAGFFSEYNNMLLAIVYCLNHKIKFKLYSKDANFGFKKGWQDYFLPFGKEANFSFHKHYNYRSLIEYNYFKSKKSDAKIKIHKWFTNTDFLTYELFDVIRSEAKNNSGYSNEFLNGSIIDILHDLDSQIFRYNRSFHQILNDEIKKLHLPEEYIGIHIRSGDKYKESKIYDPSEYINKARQVSSLKKAFISTDDFRIVRSLQQNYPGWEFYHLCPETHSGYFQDEFQKLPRLQKKNEMLELFASVEILAKSTVFIGTFKSNIGMYLGIRKNNKNCFAVDSDSWEVW